MTRIRRQCAAVLYNELHYSDMLMKVYAEIIIIKATVVFLLTVIYRREIRAIISGCVTDQHRTYF